MQVHGRSSETKMGRAAFVILAFAFIASCQALDNGLGITPPRGWRSWDAFENSVNQTRQQSQVDELVSRARSIGGKPTSLLDLGYNRIGLDDAWQNCGKGVNGSFHSADGTPLIRPDRFPDMKGMNAYARSKGIGSGWYLNSCDCCERGKLKPDWPVQMNGDVKAVKDLGFDGLKLDSCGPSQHLAEWARLLNQSGWPVLVENCFDNASFPFVPSGADDGDEKVAEDACPMNLYRTGGDMRAQWPLMLRRLQTIVPFLRLSRPGCWAYLDMLEVGNPPGGTGEQKGFENPHSWRAHFGAWTIVSSPLILSFDLTNKTKMGLVWDFISNAEALEINSDWNGEAGRLVASHYDQSAPTPLFARPCSSQVDTQKFTLTSDGRLQSSSRADKRCISVPGCPPPPSSSSSSSSSPSATPLKSKSQVKSGSGNGNGNGGLRLAKCSTLKPEESSSSSSSSSSVGSSQLWNLTTGMGAEGAARVTNVESDADGGCWEINGCGGSSIDTDYGCKALPKPNPKNSSQPLLPCTGCCNMAWRFLPNGTIVSGMDLHKCVQVSSEDEGTVIVAPCTGDKREVWHIKQSAGAGVGAGAGALVQIESAALGGCIDNHAKVPSNPQYGPMVISDCSAAAATTTTTTTTNSVSPSPSSSSSPSLHAPNGSHCGGADHRWHLDPQTKQLVSAVPGVGGERICAEVQSYFNHYSNVNAVGCAPASAVPAKQQWSVDGAKQRLYADVRFDATQSRSPGMLLCADIDIAPTASGDVKPGSRLLHQVFAKKLTKGRTAVLFLNAEPADAAAAPTRDIEVDLEALGVQAGSSVRDVWARKDLAPVAAGATSYTAAAVPPQDSRLLVFGPTAAAAAAAAAGPARGA